MYGMKAGQRGWNTENEEQVEGREDGEGNWVQVILGRSHGTEFSSM